VRFAILGFDQWHGSLGRLLEEEERALAEGYNGLRITGNTSFLTPGDWPTFMEYEQALSARFHCRRIVTIAATRGRGATISRRAKSCTRTTARSSVRTPTGR
jgi:hypothetical protein